MVKILSKPEKISEIDQVPVILTYKDVKNINIRIKSEAVQISAPAYLSASQILDSININQIRKKLQSLDASGKKPSPSPGFKPNYLRLFGRVYQTEYTDSVSEIRLHKKKVLVPRSLENSAQLIEAFDKFIDQELRKYIDKRLLHWKNITNLSPNGYQVRKMKTRWGSCTHGSGKIRFNFYLSVLPRECIDTVILHELTHLKITNHQKEFYDFINKYLPNYQKIHSRIKSYKSPETYLLSTDTEL